MKPSEIQVGKTYTNRGKGRTRRKVIAIGNEHRPAEWYGASPPDDEPGVLYEQPPKTPSGMPLKRNLYLSSFAQWAGGEAA